MPRRYFTQAEANALLAEVRPAAERLVAHRRAFSEAAARRARLTSHVAGNGGDLDRGLVDFPALRQGEEVLLCWQVGEDTVAFWHGLDEGFAGRKPLPFD